MMAPNRNQSMEKWSSILLQHRLALAHDDIHAEVHGLKQEMAGSNEVHGLPQTSMYSVISGFIWFELISTFQCWLVFAALTLAMCGHILKERFPKYYTQSRFSYPLIGYESFGKGGRYLISFCVNATQFGASVVYLLVVTENIQELLATLYRNFPFCSMLPVIAVCIWPITWLENPKEFWPLQAVGGKIFAATALLCLVAHIFNLISACGRPFTEISHPPSEFSYFLLAFGLVPSAFGTIAYYSPHRLKDGCHMDFPKLVIWIYFIAIHFYLPVSAAGFFVFGDYKKDNILAVVGPFWQTIMATVFLIVSLVIGFALFIDTLSQEVEDMIGIPKEINWKRVLNRTVIVGLVLFAAETVPRFGIILSLVGGSTVTLLTYVCPSLFYLKLCSTSCPQNTYSRKQLPVYQWFYHLTIIFCGVIVGILSSYGAINAIVTGKAQYTVPCYVNPTTAHE